MIKYINIQVTGMREHVHIIRAGTVYVLEKRYPFISQTDQDRICQLLSILNGPSTVTNEDLFKLATFIGKSGQGLHNGEQYSISVVPAAFTGRPVFWVKIKATIPTVGWRLSRTYLTLDELLKEWEISDE